MDTSEIITIFTSLIGVLVVVLTVIGMLHRQQTRNVESALQEMKEARERGKEDIAALIQQMEKARERGKEDIAAAIQQSKEDNATAIQRSDQKFAEAIRHSDTRFFHLLSKLHDTNTRINDKHEDVKDRIDDKHDDVSNYVKFVVDRLSSDNGKGSPSETPRDLVDSADSHISESTEDKTSVSV